MAPIHLKAKVGPDGVLHLEMSLGKEWAGLEADVLITPIKPPMTREDWHKFVSETAGSWRGDLERPA
jgi:hypothetical protein